MRGFGTRRRLRQRGPRRDHRVQERQTDGDARAAKERAPGEMHLRNEHHWLLFELNPRRLTRRPLQHAAGCSARAASALIVGLLSTGAVRI